MGKKHRLANAEGAAVNLAFALARAKTRISKLESELEDLRDESRVAVEALKARLAALEARPPQVLMPQAPYQRPHVPSYGIVGCCSCGRADCPYCGGTPTVTC